MDEEDPIGMETLPGGRSLFPVQNGWALDQIVEIDDAHPGFLARVCRSRLLWRQALWSCLAVGGAINPELAFRVTGETNSLDAGPRALMRDFAAFAPNMSGRDIIEASYGCCPDGLLGALRKLHGQPFSKPESYVALHSLFASEDALDRRRRAALEQSTTLDEGRLEAVLAMTQRGLLVPTVITGLDGEQAARNFEREVEVVRRFCSWATDDAIKEAISTARGIGARPFYATMLLKADRPFPREHPCDADPALERVVLGRARAIGKEFQNCLDATRIWRRALSGSWAMIAWRDEGLLIETKLGDDGAWSVARVHRPANKRVRPEHLAQVRERLAPHGVQCFVPAKDDPALAGIVKDWIGGEPSIFDDLEDWE